MAQTYALTTAQRIKDQLDITVSTFDTILERYIAGATDYIENQCNRRFKQTTYTNEIYDGSYLDGTKRTMLILKNAPIVPDSISSFQYRTGLKTNPVWTSFNADNFQEKNEVGHIMTFLPQGYQNIRISYTAGYLIDFANEYSSTHTLPHDISDLCERIVIRRYKKRGSEGKKSENFGQSSVTWGDLLDDFDKEVIADYQRPILV